MPFLRSIRFPALSSFGEEARSAYPISIPAIRSLLGTELDVKVPVTFLVGENGSGKSTLLEGLADAWGFRREGGGRDRGAYATDRWSELGPHLQLIRERNNPMDGFFLRAESFFNFATYLEELEKEPMGAHGFRSYGGTSLHDQSHGESFLALFCNRFGGDGFYLLDEPEAALSPQRQLSFLVRLHDLVASNSQFVIATHSPILLGYPGARILHLTEENVQEVTFDEAPAVQVTRDFLDDPERSLRYLLPPQP